MGAIMMCERCNQNEATIHFTEVVDGVRSEHNLCSSCAAEFNVGLGGNGFSFARLLTGLFASGRPDDEDVSDPMTHVVCPRCGMNFQEFTRIGKFGCGECYGVFGPLIDDNMKKIHGDSQHKGKTYKGVDDAQGAAAESDVVPALPSHEIILKAKLKEAIEQEEYEEAARLRDEIRALKNVD
jgi:protein arginine kinase activator